VEGEGKVAPVAVLMQSFPGITEPDAAKIIACGRVFTAPPGTAICREGEYGQAFYILLEGEAVVVRQDGAAEERRLNDLKAGEFFGEMAIIGNAPRVATVRTVTPATLLEIHKEAFTGLIQSNNATLLAIVRAVTERMRYNDRMTTEDLRMKAKELADAYQQLAEEEYARSQFLSTVAHALRTPLTAANGFLQAIRMGMLQGEALNAAIDVVSRNVQEIITLTNDILFLQEMDMIMPEFQPVNIASLLTAIVDQLRDHAEKNQVGIRLAIAPTVAVVQGHAKSLQRAFAALLDNAIKFSPEGGEVIINATRDEHHIIISFTDHGVGIPPEVLPRIFQRFYHTERMGRHLFHGIGIGLPIARQVIKQHCGYIQVQSEVGRGSTFTVYLNASHP